MYDPHKHLSPTFTNRRFLRYAEILRLASTDPEPPVTALQAARHRLAKAVKALAADPAVRNCKTAALALAAQNGNLRLSDLTRQGFAKQQATQALQLACTELALRVAAYSGAFAVYELFPVDERPTPKAPRGRPPSRLSLLLAELEPGDALRTGLKPSAAIGPSSWVTRNFPTRRFTWTSDDLGIKTIKRTS